MLERLLELRTLALKVGLKHMVKGNLHPDTNSESSTTTKNGAKLKRATKGDLQTYKAAIQVKAESLDTWLKFKNVKGNFGGI